MECSRLGGESHLCKESAEAGTFVPVSPSTYVRGLVSACPGRRIWLWLEFVSDSHVTAGSQQRFCRDGNS